MYAQKFRVDVVIRGQRRVTQSAVDRGNGSGYACAGKKRTQELL